MPLLYLLLTLLTLTAAQAATITGGILAASDTSGTNARPQRVTITALTNLQSGTLTATNNLSVGGAASIVGTLSVTDQITNSALQASSVVYSSATKVLSSISPGDPGDVLTSAGAGVAPSFSPPTGGSNIWTNDSGTISATSSAADGGNAFLMQTSNEFTFGTLLTIKNDDDVVLQVREDGGIQMQYEGGADESAYYLPFALEIYANSLQDLVVLEAGEDYFGRPALGISTDSGATFIAALDPSAPDGTTPFTLGTKLTHTSGNLLEVKNNATNKFTVDYAGNGVFSGTVTANGSLLGPTPTGTVIGFGTTAANNIAVFTDTTHTNIARSTGAGILGDASSATYTLTYNLSGATDPVLTAANNSLSVNVPFIVPAGASTAPSYGFSNGANHGIYSRAAGFTTITKASDGDLAEFSAATFQLKNNVALQWSASTIGAGSDTYLSRDSAGVVKVTSNGTALSGLKAGTLTLTPAVANTTAVTVSGGSNTGSDVTPGDSYSWTWNTSGDVIGKDNNIANTASGAGSLMERWRMGNTNKVTFSKHGQITAQEGYSSAASDAAVSITDTGWTNSFNKNAVAYFDGVALVYTIYNGAGTPIYTNTATTASATVVLQPSGKFIITAGTGAVGIATPF